MDETTIKQLNLILKELRRMAYAIKRPEFILLDLDSTLLDTYGKQEGKAFNFHYQNVGYHPLLCHDSSELDAKQKNEVAAWAYEIYCDFCKANVGIPSEPEKVAEIAGKLSKKMSAGKILMPEKPVQVYVNSKMASFQKKFEKELAK